MLEALRNLERLQSEAVGKDEKVQPLPHQSSFSSQPTISYFRHCASLLSSQLQASDAKVIILDRQLQEKSRLLQILQQGNLEKDRQLKHQTAIATEAFLRELAIRQTAGDSRSGELVMATFQSMKQAEEQRADQEIKKAVNAAYFTDCPQALTALCLTDLLLIYVGISYHMAGGQV